MDKVQKHTSFNTNTPSPESYRNYSMKISETFPIEVEMLSFRLNNGNSSATLI